MTMYNYCSTCEMYNISHKFCPECGTKIIPAKKRGFYQRYGVKCIDQDELVDDLDCKCPDCSEDYVYLGVEGITFNGSPVRGMASKVIQCPKCKEEIRVR